MVLDVMMPVLDGFEVCKRLRARSTVPIIMLTAKSDEVDTIVGLELGADDYITKPFSVREFRSRVKAALRRASITREEAVAGEEPLEIHELRIDPARRAVTVRGAEVRLTFVEFEILTSLARRPGLVWSARAAARRGLGRQLLPRPAHGRRPHPPPAREDRDRPARARVHLHRARRRLPLPRPLRADGTRPRSTRVKTLANRLALIFLLITLGVIAIVYVGVVPNLRASLVDERGNSLRGDARRDAPAIARAITGGVTQRELDQVVRSAADQANARVTLLSVGADGLGSTAARPLGLQRPRRHRRPRLPGRLGGRPGAAPGNGNRGRGGRPRRAVRAAAVLPRRGLG